MDRTFSIYKKNCVEISRAENEKISLREYDTDEKDTKIYIYIKSKPHKPSYNNKTTNIRKYKKKVSKCK